LLPWVKCLHLAYRNIENFLGGVQRYRLDWVGLGFSRISHRHPPVPVVANVSVSGFNIGINSGEVAGQTIGHAPTSTCSLVVKAMCKTQEAV
jgi:hypothetical protein